MSPWNEKSYILLSEFKCSNQLSSGQILFDEFCNWAIKKNLDLEDDDDNVEDNAFLDQVEAITNEQANRWGDDNEDDQDTYLENPQQNIKSKLHKICAPSQFYFYFS